MLRPSPFRVRFALVGIFTLLVVGFTVSDAQSQFGRPPGGIGGHPTGIGGIGGMPIRPPGGIGGIGGMPGGITGMPGGIAGMPGAGIAGMPGGHGISGITGIQTVYYCPRCGYTQSTPGICPRCSGGGGVFGSPPGGSPFASGTPAMPTMPLGFGGTPGTTPTMPGSGNPLAGGLQLPTNPAAGGATFPTSTPFTSNPDVNPAPSTTPPSDSSSASNSSSDSSSGSSGGGKKTFAIIGIVIGTVVLLAVVGLMIAVANSGNGRKVKRPRRRVVNDYDD